MFLHGHLLGKPRHARGFLCLSVLAGTDFSEPEIDCLVMAITAAEAVQGVHFTPEMEGFDAGPRDNQ
jgi:hypothetical protein